MPPTRTWALLALLLTGCGRESTAPAAAMLALTPTEYNNTVRDLLGFSEDVDQWPDAPEIAERLTADQGEPSVIFGVSSAQRDPWPWDFPAENGVDGFEGMADGQEPSAYQLEELQKAAVHYAAYTLVSDIFFTCDGWSGLAESAQKQCGEESVLRFAERAFRRPMRDGERTRLQAQWDAQWSAGEPEEAVLITVAGILQSPQFLFRVEIGDEEAEQDGVRPLTDWEMASRLSYLLWDTMPDSALFAAASSGALSTDDGLRSQVDRMLADERAEDTLVHFHHQWLGTDSVLSISPARSAYGPLYGLNPDTALDTTDDGSWPAILGPVRHSMAAEVHLMVTDTLLAGEGTLTALLTAEEGYLSDVTAPLYGEVTTVEGADKVSWDYTTVSASLALEGTLSLYRVRYPDGQRAGLLTLPAVMAVGAYAVHPAPILRGQTVLERLTCTSFGPPPAGAEGSAPADTLDAASTNRARTEAATEAPECDACHQTLNPPGFAFEHYDAMGRWRAEDNSEPVDASGSFSVANETFTFTDGVDLSAQLAASPRVRRCYALHWTRVAAGEHLDEDDGRIAALLEGFVATDHVPTLLESIVLSDLFRTIESTGGRR